MPTAPQQEGTEVCVLKLPRYAKLPIVLLAFAVALATFGHLSAGEDSAAVPLPFDPLSEDEQQAAIDAALADPGITQRLSERFVVIGASLNTDKDAMMSDDPPRRADVQIYDYERDHVVFAIVDLGQSRVATLVPVPHYQPTLTGNEIVHAAELAADYPGVDARLPGEHDIQHIAHLWTGPDSDCPGKHRCVTIGHFIDGFPDFSFFVLVDLSADHVIKIMSNDGWNQEADA